MGGSFVPLGGGPALKAGTPTSSWLVAHDADIMRVTRNRKAMVRILRSVRG
jgi:hypothetical protein